MAPLTLALGWLMKLAGLEWHSMVELATDLSALADSRLSSVRKSAVPVL